MTVQASCADNDALDYVREQERKIAEMFAYVPHKIASLADRLSREIERIEAMLPKFHAQEAAEFRHARALLDAAIQVHRNADELPMAELVTALRRVSL